MLQALRKLGHDHLIPMLCVTVFLSYLPEAGEYSCFFVYLRLVSYYFSLLSNRPAHCWWMLVFLCLSHPGELGTFPECLTCRDGKMFVSRAYPTGRRAAKQDVQVLPIYFCQQHPTCLHISPPLNLVTCIPDAEEFSCLLYFSQPGELISNPWCPTLLP